MGRGKHTIAEWLAVRDALRSGATVRAAAELAGVGRGTAHRWGRMDGPPDWMWLGMDVDVTVPAGPGRAPGARLAYEDRVIIFEMRRRGATHAEIAAAVGCHRSTVSRELARMPEGGYDPRVAQGQAWRAARRPRARRLDADPRLRRYVVRGLALRWSPEQISRRIREEFPGDGGMRVSHETIYQALYVQGRGSLRHELGVRVALRSGRGGRKPRSRLPARGGRPWVEGRHVSARPPEAEDRAVPGHWEGDLVVGGDMSSCLVTLVERRSRFLLASRLDAHDAETVERRLERMVAGLPAELARTLTWDQGSEMARAADFELATGFRVYLCDPHSPWQRPTNENTNGLIREFFPKGTRFDRVTDEEVAEAVWLLNNRPRKVLGWKFPAEVMQEVLAEGATIA